MEIKFISLLIVLTLSKVVLAGGGGGSIGGGPAPKDQVWIDIEPVDIQGIDNGDINWNEFESRIQEDGPSFVSVDIRSGLVIRDANKPDREWNSEFVIEAAQKNDIYGVIYDRDQRGHELLLGACEEQGLSDICDTQEYEVIDYKKGTIDHLSVKELEAELDFLVP